LLKELKVEQLAEDGFLFVITAVVVLVVPAVLVVDRGLLVHRLLRSIDLLRGRLRSGCGGHGCRLFNNFVEFSTIKPDAAALGAVVDLDAAAFRHHEIYVAMWAIHKKPPGGN
jgi:hypothetical protein